MDQFDVVLWVAAENEISISQSFRAVAEGLELLRTDDETKDSAAAMLKVKNWLVTTRGSLPAPLEAVFLNLD